MVISDSHTAALIFLYIDALVFCSVFNDGMSRSLAANLRGHTLCGYAP